MISKFAKITDYIMKGDLNIMQLLNITIMEVILCAAICVCVAIIAYRTGQADAYDYLKRKYNFKDEFY